eukprot:CAMPEP_0194193836 /NCGR_PEP_ID=MMETSP0154-20130528/75254_1 /TAXON_ID=1049557 /ORGANISM="Thalassiothrix antarctica, Strain L6-D1" /LENGTH=619 /DNA_ID=CAMNT_0038918209 /DNA_START=171 /DNA_END=2031 /DNA_ORIENTATION=+
MAASIPFDPSMVLGQVVEKQKITNLQTIADIQKPLNQAHDALNNVLRTIYKLNMVKTEMENIGVDDDSIEAFEANITALEDSVVEAAIGYGTTATKVFEQLEAEQEKQGQNQISLGIESPMDYGKSEVTQFPLSFDSLEFDVQYMRNEMIDQTSSADSKQSKEKESSFKTENITSGGVTTVTKHKIRKWWWQRQRYRYTSTTTPVKIEGTSKTTTESTNNNNSNLTKQYENHKIEGTIVISAIATHKNASVISPFVLDPIKAVSAWNYTYPEDQIRTEPNNILSAALDDFKYNNNNSSLLKQYENHKIEGTIVISAIATHKNASVISPFVLDPIKAVSAWNYTYPEDQIRTEPNNILSAALDDFKGDPSKKPTLDILSGCAKSSSFVGFVHIMQNEKTTSSQSAASAIEEVKSSFEKDAWQSSASGGFGTSNTSSSTAKSLNSTSFIQNHANIVCQGIIPSIVCNEVTTAVKRMAPDAAKIMEQQSAIAEASAASAGGEGEGEEESSGDVEQSIEGGKKGAQFQTLNSEHLANTVSNLSEYQTEANKVIDTNSMMTALDDFIVKATEGEGGVPTSFYIKHLTKNDIAKEYIKKFYPNGLKSAADRRKGMLGISSGEDEE